MTNSVVNGDNIAGASVISNCPDLIVSELPVVSFDSFGCLMSENMDRVQHVFGAIYPLEVVCVVIGPIPVDVVYKVAVLRAAVTKCISDKPMDKNRACFAFP